MRLASVLKTHRISGLVLAASPPAGHLEELERACRDAHVPIVRYDDPALMTAAALLAPHPREMNVDSKPGKRSTAVTAAAGRRP